MQASSFWNKKLFGIRYWELSLAIGLYLFFSLTYNLALYLTSNGKSEFYPTVVFEYSIKAIYTIPIWWLMFRKLAHWTLYQKLGMHFLLLSIFVFAQQQTYYWICDQLGEWHLDWPAAWWDIYIPGMFYIVQFGIFHTYDYYQKLQQQRLLEAELRQATLKSELVALKAQLNPHFLYNIFNTINASIPAKMEGTREMIATLSDLFRYQMRGSQQELVPLSEELAFVRKYLELEKARFGDRLHFHFELEDDILSFQVPPMIIQPLVENAIKHGISPKIEGGEVWIRASVHRKMLYFEVSDSGQGLTDKQPFFNGGIGLSNTRLRLEKMYGSSLQLEERKEGGVRVFFYIPLNHKALVS